MFSLYLLTIFYKYSESRVENNQTCLKLFARDASYLIQRFRKSSAEEKEFIHFSFAETHPILSKDSETRPNTDTIRRNNASSRGGKAGATASPTRPGSPATPFENKAGRLGRVPAVRQRSGTERLVRFRRSSRLPRHLPGKPSVEDWCYNATFTLSSPTFII